VVIGNHLRLSGRIDIMRKIAGAAIAAIGFVCLIGTATATELTAAEIKELISGKSVYLELTAASVTGTPGQGVLYYAADGSALYKTAKGTMWHGTWTIKDNTTCTVWKEAPDSSCTKWDKQGDTISLINVATGKTRGKVLKTVAGNTEKLAP
jgi:hypothetical protein